MGGVHESVGHAVKIYLGLTLLIGVLVMGAVAEATPVIGSAKVGATPGVYRLVEMKAGRLRWTPGNYRLVALVAPRTDGSMVFSLGDSCGEVRRSLLNGATMVEAGTRCSAGAAVAREILREVDRPTVSRGRIEFRARSGHLVLMSGGDTPPTGTWIVTQAESTSLVGRRLTFDKLLRFEDDCTAARAMIGFADRTIIFGEVSANAVPPCPGGDAVWLLTKARTARVDVSGSTMVWQFPAGAPLLFSKA